MKQQIITQVQEPLGFLACVKDYLVWFLSCDFIRNWAAQQVVYKPIVMPRQIDKSKKSLVIDLDETLVHSAFQYIPDPDFIVKVTVQSQRYTIYVRVRPGAEQFLQEMSKHYELIIFTASLPEYANPVIDKIDKNRLCSARLFRANCSRVNGIFVKDLSLLNRNLKDLIIIDNSITSFQLQPNNAIHISNFFSDTNDKELYDLIPFLKVMSKVNDVRPLKEYLIKYNRYEPITFEDVNQQRMTYDRKNDMIQDVIYIQKGTQLDSGCIKIRR